MSALRWLAFVAGIVIVVGTTSSVVGALVLPRGTYSRVSRLCDRMTDLGYRSLARRAPGQIWRDRILAWQAPTLLVTRLMVWVLLILLGYSLILVPLVSRSGSGAFIEAGSSLFTLGSTEPANTHTAVVSYLAAFTGLAVIGLQTAYLPTLYAAFTARETEVTLLSARSGVPAWGPEILARTQWGILESDTKEVLRRLFHRWEQWSAQLDESHTTYLVLIRFRSPKPLSNWLTSMLAVLDAAALHLSLAPQSEPKLAARFCLRMGFVALQDIASAMRIPVERQPDADGDIDLPYAEFARAVDMLTSVGYPVEVSAEQAWPDFRGWRINYEAPAYAIARAIDAPPALWSGDRRWPFTPIPPQRPSPGRRGARPGKDGEAPASSRPDSRAATAVGSRPPAR